MKRRGPSQPCIFLRFLKAHEKKIIEKKKHTHNTDTDTAQLERHTDTHHNRSLYNIKLTTTTLLPNPIPHYKRSLTLPYDYFPFAHTARRKKISRTLKIKAGYVRKNKTQT